MQGYAFFFPIAYSATDVAIYQQDVVIHRSEGTSYEETVSDLNVWHVYVGDRCKSDYGDIRFTDAAGTALDYYLWPDYDAESARFTVRLEGATTAGELLVWYGNPTATTTSDGDAVYLFFDQFDGAALDTTKWDVIGSQSISVASGVLTITGRNNPSDCVWSKPGFSGAGYTFQFRFRFSGVYGSSMVGVANTDCTDYIGCWDTTGMGVISCRESAITYSGSPRTVYTDAVIHWISDTDTDVYLDGALALNPPAQNCPRASETLKVRLRQYGSGYSQFVDYVVVRAYSTTPPAATAFGPEQASGNLHHVQGVVFGSANMMVI